MSKRHGKPVRVRICPHGCGCCFRSRHRRWMAWCPFCGGRLNALALGQIIEAAAKADRFKFTVET